MDPSPSSAEPLATGSHGAYRWLSSGHELDDLLRLCPAVVLGKYVAVTSFDSSYLIPSAEEKSAGWKSRGGIAYSPMIQSIESLPHGGSDEWYVLTHKADLGVSRLGGNIFDPPIKPGELGVFVNYCFALHSGEMENLADLFWGQIERFQPESYIADNDCVTFVTRDESLFRALAEALSHAP